MKICLYLELEEQLKVSGIGSAIRNQRKSLELNNIEYTSDLEDDFDILHLNILGLKSLYLAWKMKRAGKKVIIHAHTTADDFRNSFRFSNTISPHLGRCLTSYYNQADLILCPSDYTKTVLERYGVSSPIKWISNGVDTDKFVYSKEKRRIFRKEHNLANVTPLCVGHMFIRKGVDTFMKAASNHKQRFIWVGRRYRNLESRRIQKLVRNKPDNLLLIEYIDDILDAYCGTDLFFFPSRCENQGIVLLEAAACGRPILCRNLPAYDGFMVDEVNCLKAGSDGEMLEKLDVLLDDGKLRDKLSKNALKMSDEHSLGNVGAQLKKIYETVLEGE
ncbi:MAG: glycosyltransferase [Candidatus Altiarchaeota archaeon]|nr:glycosyltransferase [Candidatus Altiarchaeota archaeon]